MGPMLSLLSLVYTMFSWISQLQLEEDWALVTEILENWLVKAFGTSGSRPLDNNDLIAERVSSEIAEIGQFAEATYSPVPLQLLISNYATLRQPGHPLEQYQALSPDNCVLLSSFRVSQGSRLLYILYRPFYRQLVVAIPGTSTPEQMIHGFCMARTRHPSGRGRVHSGFWAIYKETKNAMMEGIRKGIQKHRPDKLILTGHSLGGSLCYLLLIDLLLDCDWLLRKLEGVNIVVFGTPRTGDADLVNYYRNLVAESEYKYGEGFIQEYSIKSHNDAITAFPPTYLGYRHFSGNPLFTLGRSLYQIPCMDSEHSIFTSKSKGRGRETRLFPIGGHDYYNGRYIQEFRRRTKWLARADIGKSGWEDRYKKFARL